MHDFLLGGCIWQLPIDTFGDAAINKLRKECLGGDIISCFVAARVESTLLA